MAADSQSEVSFLFPQETLSWQANFFWFWCMVVAVRSWLVVQPGGLMLGFALHPVSF